MAELIVLHLPRPRLALRHLVHERREAGADLNQCNAAMGKATRTRKVQTYFTDEHRLAGSEPQTRGVSEPHTRYVSEPQTRDVGRSNATEASFEK